MSAVSHDEQSLERWRDGVMTRMRMSALLGSRQLCIFDQFCDPGLGAPTHVHAVEEVLEVMHGHAEVWVGEKTAMLRSNQSIVVPAGVLHGFRNAAAADTLHVRATLAAPIFEASYEDGSGTQRRWSPHRPVP